MGDDVDGHSRSGWDESPLLRLCSRLERAALEAPDPDAPMRAARAYDIVGANATPAERGVALLRQSELHQAAARRHRDAGSSFAVTVSLEAAGVLLLERALLSGDPHVGWMAQFRLCHHHLGRGEAAAARAYADAMAAHPDDAPDPEEIPLLLEEIHDQIAAQRRRGPGSAPTPPIGGSALTVAIFDALRENLPEWVTMGRDTRAPQGARPWRPLGVPALPANDLHYLWIDGVSDEPTGDTAVRVGPWPVVDGHGALRWTSVCAGEPTAWMSTIDILSGVDRCIRQGIIDENWDRVSVGDAYALARCAPDDADLTDCDGEGWRIVADVTAAARLSDTLARRRAQQELDADGGLV